MNATLSHTPSESIESARAPRSPLKETTLRRAGQSIEERITEQRDSCDEYLVLVVLAMVLMISEWLRYYRADTFHPWIYTSIFFGISGICAIKFRRRLQLIRRLKLGRDGERQVAERLEELRSHGFAVLHDIVCGNFNIDHVLIGPSGIYAIETKTRTKRGGREEIAVFDGRTVLLGGYEMTPNPIHQAQACAKWLRETLAASTGRTFAVGSVVVFPGWYVEQRHPRRDVLVLNDDVKTLRAFLVDQPAQLSTEHIHLARYHLDRYVRTTLG